MIKYSFTKKNFPLGLYVGSSIINHSLKDIPYPVARYEHFEQ